MGKSYKNNSRTKAAIYDQTSKTHVGELFIELSVIAFYYKSVRMPFFLTWNLDAWCQEKVSTERNTDDSYTRKFYLDSRKKVNFKRTVPQHLHRNMPFNLFKGKN